MSRAGVDERLGASPATKEPTMSTRAPMLALAAIATLALPALVPASASAFGFRTAAPTRVVMSHPGQALGWGYGRGYGRGWCYWHPYACYYR
jgi:hypothetical protein